MMESQENVATVIEISQRVSAQKRSARMSDDYGDPRKDDPEWASKQRHPSQIDGSEPEPTVGQIEGKAGKIIRDCLANDEPFFVFRAKDILTPMVLNHYHKLLDDYGSMDVEHQTQVADFRALVIDWQRNHVEDVRFPD
jgi:hypothetical protein